LRVCVPGRAVESEAVRLGVQIGGRTVEGRFVRLFFREAGFRLREEFEDFGAAVEGRDEVGAGELGARPIEDVAGACEAAIAS
jgi:hypothetical protein